MAVGDGGNNSVDHLQHLRRARCSRDAQRRPGHQSHACSTDASAKALELAGIRRGTDTMQQDPKCCQTHHTWENKAESSRETAQNACLQRSDRYRHLVRRWVGLVWFCIRRSMPPISKGDHVLLNMCRDNAVMAAVHLEGHNPHTARARECKKPVWRQGPEDTEQGQRVPRRHAAAAT